VHCAAVIPCLNEADQIGPLVTSVLPFLADIIVVDDGSGDRTAQEATAAGAEVIRHESNRGKGAAVQTGLKGATERAFEWALLMDGDGQHSASDIVNFWEGECPREPAARLVIGNRMHNPAAMPWLRRFVNRWMSARLSKRLGLPLPDTQCGFRLVHLPSWSKLDLQMSHFEIESEMLTAFVQAGYLVRFVPIQVIYKNESSKISPIVDTIRWFRWWSSKRQRIAALQNLPGIAKGHGLRQSSAAFENPHAS
jgi:glycosyltransferase involved in cell wall biosynthesis